MPAPTGSELQGFLSVVTTITPVILQGIDVLINAWEYWGRPSRESVQKLRAAKDKLEATYREFEAVLNNALQQVCQGDAEAVTQEVRQLSNRFDERFNAVYGQALKTLTKLEDANRHDRKLSQLAESLRRQLRAVKNSWDNTLKVLRSDDPASAKCNTLRHLQDAVRGFVDNVLEEAGALEQEAKNEPPAAAAAA